MPTLQQFIESHSMPAAPALVVKESGGVRCLSCANRCLIAENKTGVCRVRFNRGGELRVPSGYVAGLQVDPIEKKPFFHVFPGRAALSFGMLSCNFHCAFCQNWLSSQIMREPYDAGLPVPCTPEQIVARALDQGAPALVSTYNEPLITSDWAAEVFSLARENGIVCGYVSNGHATREVIEFLRPWMQLYKVDLKCFREAGYRELGGKLETVCDTIATLKSLGFWVEIVTLVIPGFNDSLAELTATAQFIAGVSPSIPWHVTAFHPDYKMTQPRRTTPADLRRAYDAGKNAGLDFVYSGNLPGSVGSTENTYCPACNALLIERRGFHVPQNRIRANACPDCHADIPGIWETPTQASSDVPPSC